MLELQLHRRGARQANWKWAQLCRRLCVYALYCARRARRARSPARSGRRSRTCLHPQERSYLNNKSLASSGLKLRRQLYCGAPSGHRRPAGGRRSCACCVARPALIDGRPEVVAREPSRQTAAGRCVVIVRGRPRQQQVACFGRQIIAAIIVTAARRTRGVIAARAPCANVNASVNDEPADGRCQLHARRVSLSLSGGLMRR